MTTDDIAVLESNLATLSFSGRIGYDPTDPALSTLIGSLGLSGRVLADISIRKDRDG
jgi:hypothetical protein